MNLKPAARAAALASAPSAVGGTSAVAPTPGASRSTNARPAGRCSSAASCRSAFDPTRCTSGGGGGADTCETHLEDCFAACEGDEADGPARDSRCRCLLDSKGVEWDVIDGLVACEERVGCASLTNDFDCGMTWGCEWTLGDGDGDDADAQTTAVASAVEAMTKTSTNTLAPKLGTATRTMVIPVIQEDFKLVADTDSIAIDGTTVVVGAHGYYSGGTGMVRVFVREAGPSWILQAELMASDASVRDSFGWSVALSGDILVVGAPLDDDKGDNSGSAYVFVRSNGGWVEETKLTASDGAEYDQYGISVDIESDTSGTIAVGAHKVNVNGAIAAGAVYVYVWDGSAWVEEAKLTASDGATGDALGSSVAIDGNTIVSAAPSDDYSGRVSGTAYIFVRGTSSGVWTEQAELRAIDDANNNWSIIPVVISGDTVVVGYSGVDAAYVFGRSGSSWTLRAKLGADEGAAGNQFGISVAIQGTVVVVGDHLDDNEGGTDSGSAYVFGQSDSTSWTQLAKLTASDGKNLGHCVSISGDYAAVGASGSSYIFNISEEALSQRIPQQASTTAPTLSTAGDPTQTNDPTHVPAVDPISTPTPVPSRKMMVPAGAIVVDPPFCPDIGSAPSKRNLLEHSLVQAGTGRTADKLVMKTNSTTATNLHLSDTCQCATANSFCGTDSQCYSLTCANYYKWGIANFTGRSHDSKSAESNAKTEAAGPLICELIDDAQNDDATRVPWAVLYGCSYSRDGCVNTQEEKRRSFFFNKVCTAEPKLGFKFVCYELDEKTDFDFWLYDIGGGGGGDTLPADCTIPKFHFRQRFERRVDTSLNVSRPDWEDPVSDTSGSLTVFSAASAVGSTISTRLTGPPPTSPPTTFPPTQSPSVPKEGPSTDSPTKMAPTPSDNNDSSSAAAVVTTHVAYHLASVIMSIIVMLRC